LASSREPPFGARTSRAKAQSREEKTAKSDQPFFAILDLRDRLR